MRLHTLRVTAFQPFAGTEEIDFDALGQAGLFLMQGETGAGKTAILDAICFALFGRVPGVRDSAPRLRSDHSAGSARTEVVLELTLSGRRLRVRRSPKQERPKVRGEGFTEEPARATLEVRAPSGEWSVLAERIEAVEHELEELLGLTLSQFCQVVLLPQGAFAKFLHAGTDERERLLQQLFSTDRYADAQEWLAEQRRTAESSVFQGLDAVGDIASRIAQVAGEEPPEDWRREPALLHTWLDGRLVLAQAGEATAEGERNLRVANRDRVTSDHAGAVTLAQLQARHRDAHAALSRHQAALSEREQAALALERARRAAPAALLAEQARIAERAMVAVREAAQAALQTAELEPEPPQIEQLSLEAETVAAVPLPTAARAREHAGELREQAVLAQTSRDVEARLQAEGGHIEALRSSLIQAENCVAEHEAWLGSAQEARIALAQAAEQAKEAVAQLPGMEQALTQLVRRAEAAAVRDQLMVRIQVVGAEASEAHQTELVARQAWLDARQLRLDGIAAELAKELKQGEPCRVCGSVEHPVPACAEPDQVVDAADEERLQGRYDKAAAAHAQIRTALGELEQECSGVRALAGEDDATELAQQAETARIALARASEVAVRATSAVQALNTHEEDCERRRTEQGAARELIARLRSEQEARTEALTQAEAQVRSARAGFRTIDGRLSWIEKRAQALDDAADALDRLAEAAREHDRRLREAREQALLSGFEGPRDACEAALAPEQVAKLQHLIEQFDSEVARARAQVEDPELAAAAAQPPADPAGLAAHLAGCEAELQDAQQSLVLATRRAEDLRELAGELHARMEALEPLLERRALVGSVSGLADGSSVANRMRMPLSAYVLTARLEQIAEAASVRLEQMSGGRYLLAHCDERIGRNRKGGLGLEVLDAWTGRERPPSSLSGGETFQASLALALGLADVVSAEAGGARLQTLFVDEGFGSLGDRALDDVLDVLDSLREGGRAVGVISHVSEMRQRIPVQLHVEKRQNGSRILQALSGA